MYKNIVINLDLLYTWKDEFVLVSITNNILQYKPDLSKQEGYIVNLKSDNFKNKFHNVVNTIDLDDSICLTDYLYTNANNALEHPTTKVTSILINHKNLRILINLMSEVPVLTY